MIDQFKEFLSFEQLHNLKFSNIPNKKGLYIVTKPKDINVVFTWDTTAIKEFNKRSMLDDTEKLVSKFDSSDKEIL